MFKSLLILAMICLSLVVFFELAITIKNGENLPTKRETIIVSLLWAFALGFVAFLLTRVENMAIKISVGVLFACFAFIFRKKIGSLN